MPRGGGPAELAFFLLFDAFVLLARAYGPTAVGSGIKVAKFIHFKPKKFEFFVKCNLFSLLYEFTLLHRHTLGQIPGFVHIRAARAGRVVRQ
jgi:hypothetical protein